MHSKEEIPTEELDRYAADLREYVRTICESSAFRTSPKSCEFLCHIVENTLGGNVEVLKERLIGMTLLGRNASYDTGADAGVRVRANDMRKRLTAYYKTADAEQEFSIEIPPGGYVPRFFRKASLSSYSQEQRGAPTPAPAADDALPRLSFYRLAGPTLAALFLCTVCMRWQMAEEHPFTAFWQAVFQGRSALLYLPPGDSKGDQEFIDVQELKAAEPLFSVAGQFHKQFSVISGPEAVAAAGDVLVSLGGTRGSRAEHTRFVIENTPAGRQIIDRHPSDDRPAISSHAALLTISNGAWRSIRIDGTDDSAVDSAIQMLCERDAFPEAVVDSFQRGTITQVVIPISPRSEPRIFRGLLPFDQPTTELRLQ
jgi:hypothetical protein